MPASFEPTSFDVAASAGHYSVDIEPGLLGRIAGDDGDRIFIADAFIVPVLTAAGIDPIVIVADEPAKSLDRMTDVIVALRERGGTRSTTIVAVGGGIVQDIAAFAASVYMRGIKWTYVPTTLLSMADSCIGGKSSINVGRYKNIVGTIHPPVRVVIDPEVTATLSDEDRAAGLLEAAKICYCRGPTAFDAYMALGPGVDNSPSTLASVLEHSLRAKKYFIEIDEFDTGERLLLNFGHTFGHAIEAASNFAIGHGIAVGLGMLTALQLCADGTGDGDRVARLRSHIHALLSSTDGLASKLAELQGPALLDAFGSDKKHGRTEYAVIVVDADGTVVRRPMPRTAATDAAISDAFSAAFAAIAARQADLRQAKGTAGAGS